MSMRLVRLVALSPHPLLRRQSRTRELLAWVADFADDNGVAFPSLTTIAARMGMSIERRGKDESDAVRDLRRARRELMAAGLLRQTGSTRGRVPVVQIVVGPLLDPGVKSPGVSETTPGSSHPGGEGSMTPGIPGVTWPPDPGVKSPPRSSQDPVSEPVNENPPPASAHADAQDEPSETGGRVDFFARVAATAKAVVERYMADEDRPFDEVVMASTRAKLVAAVAAQLQVATDNTSLRARAQDILRAWELLRDDGWWRSQPEARRRSCVRLAWLVGDAERIEARFERAAEVPQWQPNGEITQ